MSTNMIVIVAYTIVVKHFNWVRSEWVERVNQLNRKQFFPNRTCKKRNQPKSTRAGLSRTGPIAKCTHQIVLAHTMYSILSEYSMYYNVHWLTDTQSSSSISNLSLSVIQVNC